MGEDIEKAGWVECCVGDVSNLIRGVTYKREQSGKTPHAKMTPILRANNISKNLTFEDLVYVEKSLVKPEQIIQENDIIFAMSSGSKKHVGKSAIASHGYDGSFGAFCGLLRVASSITAKYLSYCFSSNEFRRHIEGISKGTNINNLKREHILEYVFPLPPENEQHRIVAKIEELFSELDKGIESLKTAREQLKVYRQAVLKHAFEGKLTTQWREENKDRLETADQLLARIQKERDARYQQQIEEWEVVVKEWEKNEKPGKKPAKPKKPIVFEPIATEMLDEFHDLPLGWNYIHLGLVIDEPKYGTSKKCSYEHDGFGVLRIPNVVSGLIDASDLKYANFDRGEAETYNLKEGDILIIRSNGSISIVGKCALISEHDEKYLYAGYLIRLRPNDRLVSSEYLLALLSSHLVRSQIESKAKSTSGVNNINSGELQSLIVPVCSMKEQSLIVDNISITLSSLEYLESEIESNVKKSLALRQSILKKAFSGQLVEQDSNDEPASVLLERIKTEKAQQQPKKKTHRHSREGGNLERIYKPTN